jgi:four helix bundle protein
MPPFDHEKLDVYRLAIEFIAWAGEVVDAQRAAGTSLSALKHLDGASQSIANNIAEGNGERSTADRCRFLDIARGSALECAACIDGLVVRKKVAADLGDSGKGILTRIVSMLSKLIATLSVH